MDFSSLLPTAIALLSFTLPGPRARGSLAGAVVVALALASLRVAGGSDWRGAGLPPTYLSVTAALLLLGTLVALGSALRAVAGTEPSAPRTIVGLGCLVVLGLAGWVAGPVAIAGGVMRSILTLAILAAMLVLFRTLGRWLALPRRLQRLDQTLFQRTKPASSPHWGRDDAPLLALHLALAIVALIAPHLVLLLAAVAGTAATGVLLERRLDSAMGWPWAMTAGLALLALVSGFTVSVAGDAPLALDQLRDGPFSPAFEVAAALGWFLAVWPLLRLWPFHARAYGPATAVAGAAILLRVAVPVLSGGMEHWQPLIFPLLVLSAWYAAGLGRVRLALAAVATAGLISLRPGAAWAGVLLLLGEAAVSIAGRFGPTRRHAPLFARLVTIVLMTQAVPLLAGALQAQTFYTVLLAAGLAVTPLVDDPSGGAPIVR